MTPDAEQRDCSYLRLCLEERQNTGYDLRLVCPVLAELLRTVSVYAIADGPRPRIESGAVTLGQCVANILAVLRPLADIRPTPDVIAFCVHRKDFLIDWLEPIAEDLALLPKLLEQRGFTATAAHCEPLCSRLRVDTSEEARMLYASMRPVPNGLYLMPPATVTGSNYLGFRKWADLICTMSRPIPRPFIAPSRNRSLRPDSVIPEPRSSPPDEGQMRRLVNTYPAATIDLANQLVEQLAPIARIEGEERIALLEAAKRPEGREQGQASAAREMTEPLSRPMPKSQIMRALGIDGEKRFATWSEGKLIQVAKNRQLWQVRLNLCAPNEQTRLERA